MRERTHEVIIVGGGPAGLSAALILARCRRDVVVFDAGRPRNAASRGVHGFLTRDGTAPFEMLQLAREEIERYGTVEILDAEIEKAKRLSEEAIFEVTTAEGEVFRSKKLLLATGVVDELPKIEGVARFWGKSVHQCPYCDGWEWRDRRLGVYGKGKRGLSLALHLMIWSRDLVLFSDGPSGLDREGRAKLAAFGIPLNEKKILGLDGKGDRLERVLLIHGTSVAREALFFNTPSYLRTKLLSQLQCGFTHGEGVRTGKYSVTGVPGLYAAGNILRDVQLAIIAAGEGATAAFGINSELTREALEQGAETMVTAPTHRLQKNPR